MDDEDPAFKIGDYVRLSNVKQIFEKDYTPKWSFEVFKVRGIDERQLPIMYYVEDLKGEAIIGKFYKQELQKTELKDFNKQFL